MAIRSISRLQHRRGLKSDLPPKLHEGEIGWCIDTRELFIGNSDAYGGNSQILTQYTPNDQLIQHAYHGYTGVPADSISRSISRKLDDMVSVRDYGAVGNGLSDDHAAMQLAITDRYAKVIANGFSPLSGSAIIWIPAGTYRITSSLKLYPGVRLQGEGPNRTKIILDPELDFTVMQTADSNGEIEGNIGADGAALPNGITLVDLCIEQPSELGDGIRLQRGSNIRLSGVKIVGPGIGTINSGVRIESLGTSFIPRDIMLHDCEMSGFYDAVLANDPILDTRINLCKINYCANGVTLGQDPISGGPSRTKISDTLFSNIPGWGIGCFGPNPGVTSTGNSFESVGSGSTSPIMWGATAADCASIADHFSDCNEPLISNLNPSRNVIVGPQQVSISTQIPNLIGPIFIENNHPAVFQTTDLVWDSSEYNNIVLDYTMVRGTSRRVGKLTILTDGINALVQDEFNTLGTDLGIEFGYRIIAGMTILTYISTNTGVDADLYYTETKWLS
jgi:hypothetical protein